MTSRIIERAVITLDESQKKMVASGWGKGAIENAVVEKITYLSDGLKVKGYIAYPKKESEKYPCIIWNRGGLGELGVIDTFNAQGIFGLIASWGYVVFASQYRGNDGSDGREEFGGNDLNDVLNLMPLAEEIPGADASRWGIEGWSRGGLMTYLLLMKTDIFKAAVTVGGVSNLHCEKKQSKFIEQLVKRTFGNLSDEQKERFCNERSVINFAEKITAKTPLLIVHGTADDRVPVEDSIELSRILLKNRTNLKLLLFEEGTHFLRDHKEELNRVRKDWFDKFLKNNK